MHIVRAQFSWEQAPSPTMTTRSSGTIAVPSACSAPPPSLRIFAAFSHPHFISPVQTPHQSDAEQSLAPSHRLKPYEKSRSNLENPRKLEKNLIVSPIQDRPFSLPKRPFHAHLPYSVLRFPTPAFQKLLAIKFSTPGLLPSPTTSAPPKHRSARPSHPAPTSRTEGLSPSRRDTIAYSASQGRPSKRVSVTMPPAREGM